MASVVESYLQALAVDRQGTASRSSISCELSINLMENFGNLIKLKGRSLLGNVKISMGCRSEMSAKGCNISLRDTLLEGEINSKVACLIYFIGLRFGLECYLETLSIWF